MSNANANDSGRLEKLMREFSRLSSSVDNLCTGCSCPSNTRDINSKINNLEAELCVIEERVAMIESYIDSWKDR